MASNISTSVSAQATTPTVDASKKSLNHLYWIAVMMAVIGTGIGLYLSYVKIADKEAVCVKSTTFDCASVQTSAYSELVGIPVAYLGLAAYATMLTVLLLETRVNLVKDYSRLLLFAMTLFGVVYSAYLTYIEAFVLDKWCLWCVSSALLMVGLFVISLVRVMDSFNEFDELEDDEELIEAA
ncbi:MAG: vitamin K epoxide reductase family protein [Chloroflexi bacterium]|nr:vitamin K epoxide reductase family protein [Chloroflexota bacterium]